MTDDRYATTLERTHHPQVESYLDDEALQDVLAIGIHVPSLKDNLERFDNIKQRVEARGRTCQGVDSSSGVAELVREFVARSLAAGDSRFLEEFKQVGYSLRPATDEELAEELEDKADKWLNNDYTGQAEINVTNDFSQVTGKLNNNQDKYEQIKQELGLVEDDAKQLESFGDHSIDLILAFGLLGDLDLTKVAKRWCRGDDDRVYSQVADVIRNYDERAQQVSETFYQVLRQEGTCLVANREVETLTENRQVIDKLEERPAYGQDFYHSLFDQAGFDVEVSQGKDDYLLLCHK